MFWLAPMTVVIRFLVAASEFTDCAVLAAGGGLGNGVLILDDAEELELDLEPNTDSLREDVVFDAVWLELEAVAVLEVIKPALAAGVGRAVPALVAGSDFTGLAVVVGLLNVSGLMV